MTDSGLRSIEGVKVLPLDGLWRSIEQVPPEEKLVQALTYAGCEFHDEDQRFVKGPVIALAGIGGIPVAHENESDEQIKQHLESRIQGTEEMMGSAAAFSYLNSGEKRVEDLYESVTALGHFSIAHTVQLNFVIAGITEGAELELSLQRDLVHLSKLTNARTRVQNNPPIVVPEKEAVNKISGLYQQLTSVAASLRTDNSGDTLEFANSMFPINKATILLLSGDLSNFRKLIQIKDDAGKERELRAVATGLYEQLGLMWPRIIKGKE